jgi:hypothetical protein
VFKTFARFIGSLFGTTEEEPKKEPQEKIYTHQHYIELYNEYKSIYKENKEKAKELNSTFSMPPVTTWSQEAIKLRAFLDREKPFYTSSLAPFEITLQKYITSNQRKYERLVTLYREEFFSYTTRSYSNEFILKEEESLEKKAQEFALYQDVEIIKQLFIVKWQTKLDSFKSENLNSSDLPSLRMSEKKILQDYSQELSNFLSMANKEAKSLAELLSSYTYDEKHTDMYKLKTYFQESYNFSDPVDIVEYAKTQTNIDVAKDIMQIRSAIQSKLFQNVEQAEKATVDVGLEEISKILMQYISKEQEILSLYTTLTTNYFATIGQEKDFLLVNEPFELFFDNHFVDFEQKLEYYKRIYKENPPALIESPYYNRIYYSTQAKLAKVNLEMTKRISQKKLSYIEKRIFLTELKVTKREYVQEVEVILDEFLRYGERYIKEINNNQDDLDKHYENIKTIITRFDLRKEYGLF